MRTNYYTIIAVFAIGLLVSSNLSAHAMEDKKMMADKSMADKSMADKSMADKSMADKSMADKSMMSKTSISDLKKLVTNIEKSLTSEQKTKPEIKNALASLKTAVSAMEKAMSGKAMTDKKSMTDKKMMGDHAMADKSMADKTMADKSMSGKAMTHTGLKIGGFDLSNASPILGSKDAKISIIEFGDYQCPKCDQWFKNEEPKIKSQYIDTNKANLYFVDFAWLGSDSEKAAQASHCADEQGKFWQYHDALYTNQGGIQSGWANDVALKKFAANIGLDTVKFNQCLDSGKHKQHVEFNTSLGEDNNVDATPVFFIVGNGQVEKIVGPQPTSAFSSVIGKLLK